jgi:hypothetical protein
VTDLALLSNLEIVVVCLTALLAIGLITVLIRLLMRPWVLLALFAILGWVLYLNAVPG